MELSSMKKTDTSDMAGSSPMKKPDYPWGLQLHLESEAIKKLGFDNLPEAGATLNLQAKVEVTSVSVNETNDGEKRKSMSLQITDMGLSAAKDDKSAADVLYPK